MTLSEFVYTVLLKPRPLRVMANAILCRLIPPRIGVRGATVIPNPSDPVVCGALALGVYEREEIAFFSDHFKPGMTFVDVGANVGLYSALAIHQGAGAVLSVEPHPEAFLFLQKTIVANEPGCPVAMENAAAGSERGELNLYSNPDNKGDNRLYQDPMLAGCHKVRVETLDELCAKNGITSIDFLKVDVQGAEMLVFQGARNILAASPRCLIMTEFWADGLKKCGADPGGYLAFFAAQGFELRELAGGALRPFDFDGMIIGTSNRQYRNIIAFREHSPGSFSA